VTTQTATTVFLGEFETKTLLELETRGPGTYNVKMMVRCNSLLSSVFIKTNAGATVQANYFDTTSGDEATPERYDLQSHDPLSTPGVTNRILVTKIHNKPQLELIVTGGTVEFGVYVTAVSTSASDIDSALIRDGDTFFQTSNKAIPIACLDEATGKLEFIRCPLKVSIVSDDSNGTPYFLRGKVNAIPDGAVTVFSTTVPVGTIRSLKHLWVTALNDGDFSLEAGGFEIAAGRIDNVAHNVSFRFFPARPISAGTLIELKYNSDTEPTFACPVTAFLSASDVTI
jgi:hypothetical protein